MKAKIRRMRYFAAPVAALVVFFVIMAAVRAILAVSSFREMKTNLDYGIEDIQSTTKDNVAYPLYLCGNDVICGCNGDLSRVRQLDFQKLKKFYRVEEVTLADSSGRIVRSSDFGRLGTSIADYSPYKGLAVLTNLPNRACSAERSGTNFGMGPDMSYAGVSFPNGDAVMICGVSAECVERDFDGIMHICLSDWTTAHNGLHICIDIAKNKIEQEVWGHPEWLGCRPQDIGIDMKRFHPSDRRKVYRLDLEGRRYYCKALIIAGHLMVLAEPWDSYLARVNVMTLFISLVLAAFIAGAFWLVLKLRRDARRITELKQADDQRRAADMGMAKTIQENSLPSTFPPYPHLVDQMDIFARMITAKEVGGDFYDFFPIGRGRLAVVIADVSGKGVPAALFMMRAKATLKAALMGGRELGAAVAEANDQLAEDNRATMFVTVWVCIVDLTTGEVEYVNAGHNPPLMLSNGNVIFLRDRSGPLMGCVKGMVYRRQTFRLAKEDAFLLYTDGVTEASDERGVMFGEQRLSDTVAGLPRNATAREEVDGVVRAIRAFVKDAPQSDDITLLAFRMK